MSSKPFIALIFFLIGILPGLVRAETVYVNDTLRVGVRSEPNSSTPPHGVVITGMKLEVLEHTDGYIKIRSEQGVQGWIKDTYVSNEMPAKLKLATMQSSLDKLNAELQDKEKQLTQAQSQTAALVQELHALQKSNVTLHTDLKQTRANTQANHNTRNWLYVIALILLGAGGFGAGAIWHRKLAMRRLGGLRV